MEKENSVLECPTPLALMIPGAEFPHPWPLVTGPKGPPNPCGAFPNWLVTATGPKGKFSRRNFPGPVPLFQPSGEALDPMGTTNLGSPNFPPGSGTPSYPKGATSPIFPGLQKALW